MSWQAVVLIVAGLFFLTFCICIAAMIVLWRSEINSERHDTRTREERKQGLWQQSR